MRKLTALFVASTLALGAANLAHAADTTTAAPADAKPMMHHKGKFGPHEDMMFIRPEPDRRAETADPRNHERPA
ncbi:hypothetical protein EIMP300_49030 [Escherichia coli]|uniref:ATP-independent periplasmic protein-refolding chaperone n=1 Tax=Escherichia coli TaxID=562 RepID=A0A8S0FU85_ECOLX|nr:hypothetical protein EIMP300_49030 [Escherichia coli]